MLPEAEALSRELHDETRATRRLLERVPEDQLGWRPHEKSMSLQQLASHLARIPGHFAKRLQGDGMEVAPATPPAPLPPLTTAAAMVAEMEASVAAAQAFLAEASDETLLGHWKVSHSGREVFARPRLAIFRTMLLNHWYHHRGQLSVYLRILGAEVPATYGRSADEDLFSAGARQATA